jgi:hypothetical protein
MLNMTREQTNTLNCLAKKLEYANTDPDPQSLVKLTTEYNCRECNNVHQCSQFYNAIIKTCK